MALIAIDARKYFDFGIGTYVQQLVKSLAALDDRNEYLLYVDSQDANNVALPSGWNMETVDYRKYSVGEIVQFGNKVRRRGVQVFHEPHYTLPAGLKRLALVTIHDIIHLRFPQYFNVAQRAYSYSMIWHALRSSQSVTTDSEFTKQDILQTFRIPENKVNVIPLGVGDQFRELDDGVQLDDFRSKHRIERPYILYVGNVKPHKGIAILLEAFKSIRGTMDVDLVLVGGSMQQDGSLLTRAREYGILGHIHSLGRVPDDELLLAYNAAEVLVMPSYYEGFGLPALEAMACGTPVIVTNAASLPEVVGNAALIVTAGNPSELAAAMQAVLMESTTRHDLIRKGKDHVRSYTWARTARETLVLYNTIADR